MTKLTSNAVQISAAAAVVAAAHDELKRHLAPFAGACAEIEHAVASSPLRDKFYAIGQELPRWPLLRPIACDVE
jgi:hypothetical protein